MSYAGSHIEMAEQIEFVSDRQAFLGKSHSVPYGDSGEDFISRFIPYSEFFGFFVALRSAVD